MKHQLTILKPDNSFVEAFFVSDPLRNELGRIARIFELDRLSLVFLQEIEVRALSTCSRHLNSFESSVVFNLASASLDWFNELLALIAAVKQFLEPYSLSIEFN